MKEGYGGRAGTHQFDDRVIDGVRTEDVIRKQVLRRMTALFMEGLTDTEIAAIPTHISDADA